MSSGTVFESASVLESEARFGGSDPSRRSLGVVAIGKIKFGRRARQGCIKLSEFFNVDAGAVDVFSRGSSRESGWWAT